ncbi:hypothetical protein Bca4012_076075 [Brassica carinata]|uniref:Uncharacterized protein n=1 Tax=Brassica cretica TaxID=69181 RepID=A0ABQ7EGF1_BRACR|nr:hypothetical protein DY000_02021454 [Brassica cretica]
MQIPSDRSRVAFNRWFLPKYPPNVMVASATTLANVPASVDSNTPLYVPFDSLDDITHDNDDRFTPLDKTKAIRNSCFLKKTHIDRGLFTCIPSSTSAATNKQTK